MASIRIRLPRDFGDLGGIAKLLDQIPDALNMHWKLERLGGSFDWNGLDLDVLDSWLKSNTSVSGERLWRTARRNQMIDGRLVGYGHERLVVIDAFDQLIEISGGDDLLGNLLDAPGVIVVSA